jgi:hypothetical protein
MPRLNGGQRKVLEALPDVPATEKTEAALAYRTGIDRVVTVLHELERFEPPLVQFDVDSTLDTRIWWTTPAGDEVLDIEG